MKVMKPMMALASLGLLAATIAFSPVPVIPTGTAAEQTDSGPETTFDDLAKVSTFEAPKLDRRQSVFLTPPPKPREIQTPTPRPVRMPASGGTPQLRRTKSASSSGGEYEPYFRPFSTGSAAKTGLSEFKKMRLERDRRMARYREQMQRAQRRRGR